jgi:hypothetical protein
MGCYSCRQASIEPDACQFHRVSGQEKPSNQYLQGKVGSDHVQKVMDDFHSTQTLMDMNNPNSMMPLYSVANNDSSYSRPAGSQSYPPLDTRSTYPSSWTIPCSEETSPVETYNLEQSGSYLSNSVPVTNPSLYAPPYRWISPTSRPFQQATNVYYEQNPYSGAHGLPYTPSKNLAAVSSEPISPNNSMNMSSLEMNLPTRPHPRQQYRASEGVARQLPFPRTDPAQTSRNAVDNLQDQRLRSGRGNSASFLRPLQPWNPNNDALVNAISTASLNNHITVSASADGALDYLATAAIESNTGTTGTSSSPELNFTSSSLLDAMTAPAPSTTYSNFRESLSNGKPSARLIRHDSQTNMYSYANSQKRNSVDEDTSNDCKLLNGRQYEPLAHQAPQESSVPESLHRESYDNRGGTLHRPSMSTLNTSF